MELPRRRPRRHREIQALDRPGVAQRRKSPKRRLGLARPGFRFENDQPRRDGQRANRRLRRVRPGVPGHQREPGRAPEPTRARVKADIRQSSPGARLRPLPVVRVAFGDKGKRVPVRAHPIGQRQKPAEKMPQPMAVRQRLARSESRREPMSHRLPHAPLLVPPVIMRQDREPVLAVPRPRAHRAAVMGEEHRQPAFDLSPGGDFGQQPVQRRIRALGRFILPEKRRLQVVARRPVPQPLRPAPRLKRRRQLAYVMQKDQCRQPRHIDRVQRPPRRRLGPATKDRQRQQAGEHRRDIGRVMRQTMRRARLFVPLAPGGKTPVRRRCHVRPLFDPPV